VRLARVVVVDVVEVDVKLDVEDDFVVVPGTIIDVVEGPGTISGVEEVDVTVTTGCVLVSVVEVTVVISLVEVEVVDDAVKIKVSVTVTVYTEEGLMTQPTLSQTKPGKQHPPPRLSAHAV
jgi:hypothetical protein